MPIFPKKKIIRTRNMSLKKSKIFIFYSVIWKHPFLDEFQKNELLLFFCKIQKIYYGFSRFKNIYKWKKSSIAVNVDLFLNPLNFLHFKTFILLQNKSKYLFSIHDLLKIIEKGLTNHSHFELDLFFPKNPYTNQYFSRTILYQIYFHLKYYHIHIPILFHYFFLEQFQIASFEIKYESIIIKEMIRNFVFKTPFSYSSFYFSIINMIDENNYVNKWTIHEDFPREKLVNDLRNYVYIYYLILYGKLTDNQFLFYSSFLYNALYSFWKMNPHYGKKKYNIFPLNKKMSVTFFDQALSINTKNM